MIVSAAINGKAVRRTPPLYGGLVLYRRPADHYLGPWSSTGPRTAQDWEEIAGNIWCVNKILIRTIWWRHQSAPTR